MKYCKIKELKCWVCKKIKPASEFYKDARNKYGLQKSCKECQKKRNTEWNSANKERRAAKRAERYKLDKLNNPNHNSERYNKNRDDFIRRAKEYRVTVEGRFMNLLSSARRRSRDKNLEFELDLAWANEQYKLQNGKCKLTGIVLDFGFNLSSKRKVMAFSPSLDRIDPAKGYTKENTRLVCTFINLAMNHFGEAVFAQVAKAYQNKQESTKMTLNEAKQKANNTNSRIRPINDDGEPSLYAFRVVNGIVYDSKDKVENETEWEGHKFILEVL